LYLSKDVRLRPELLHVMYPQLEHFEAQRARVDPEGGSPLGPGAAAGAVRGHSVSAGRAGSAGGRVIVLGGTSEIALATVLELQSRGPREVALVGRDADGLARAAGALRAAGCAQVITVELDALDIDRHAEAVGDAFERLRGGDIVIVAVGLLGERGGMPHGRGTGPRGAAGERRRRRVADDSSRAAVCRSGEEGSSSWLSSVAAERPRRANAIYGASKAAPRRARPRFSAMSCASRTCACSSLRPGFVHTRMTEGLQPAPLSTTPQAVARIVVEGLDGRAHTVWAPRPLRWLMLVVRMLPRPLLRRIKQ